MARKQAKDDAGGAKDEPSGGGKVDALALRGRLAKEPPAPVYVIAGEEAFLRAEALAALAEVPGGDVSELPGDTAVAAILDEARTLPFLGDRRVVLVRGASDLVADEGDALAAFAARPPERSTLVLEAPKLDRRRKTTKALLERATLVACEAPDDAGLMAFVRARARVHGGELARGADAALIERLGGHDVSLGALDAEVQKLVTAGPGPVTAERVAALASVGSSEESFAMVDAIARGDVGGALGKLQTILRDGLVTGQERVRDPSAIAFILLGILRWDLGRLLRGRAMLQAGQRPFDIYGALKVFRDKDRFMARLRRATREDLGRRHEWLRQADAAMKNGGDAFATLTALLARLARRERVEPARAAAPARARA